MERKSKNLAQIFLSLKSLFIKFKWSFNVDVEPRDVRKREHTLKRTKIDFYGNIFFNFHEK